jgi:hypothetical protein
MSKSIKKFKKNQLGLFDMLNPKKTAPDLSTVDPSDIFYIGRGEYWVRKIGIINPNELSEQI